MDDRNAKKPVNFTKSLDKFTQENDDEKMERSEIRESTLPTLREMILKEKALNCRTDDSFLLRFLRSRKYDCDRAFQLLKNYYRLRSDFPAMFCMIRPSEVLKSIESRVLTVLPKRDQYGRAVMIMEAENWDPALNTMNSLFRAINFCFEMMIKDEQTQIHGVVIILNVKHFTFNQYKEVRFAHLKFFAALIQNSFPASIKELHVVNEQSFFHILYSIIYPFLSKKIKERLKFHGPNMEALVQYISPDILPEDYGGTQPPLDNSSFVEELLTYDEEFAEDAKYSYKLIPKKK